MPAYRLGAIGIYVVVPAWVSLPNPAGLNVRDCVRANSHGIMYTTSAVLSTLTIGGGVAQGMCVR